MDLGSLELTKRERLFYVINKQIPYSVLKCADYREEIGVFLGLENLTKPRKGQDLFNGTAMGNELKETHQKDIIYFCDAESM